MKIKANVTKVADCGGEILVEAQGHEVTAPDGMWAQPISFRIRDTKVNRRTFYIGRELTITVEAKP